MKKLHIKKGDTVYVNAGNDKGKTGKVLTVIPAKDRVIVEGVNVVSRKLQTNRLKRRRFLQDMFLPSRRFTRKRLSRSS